MSESLDLAVFRRYEEAQRRKAAAEAALEAAADELRAAEEAALNHLAEIGQSKAYADGKIFFLRRETRAKARDQEYTASVLKELGLAALVKEGVNAHTLSAWVRAEIEEHGSLDHLDQSLLDAIDLYQGYRLGSRTQRTS